MKPRSLRHRLEKAAKLLVIVQKHAPDVSCILDQEKGENGHLVVDFDCSGSSWHKMTALGKDLEGRGYKFSEKKSPWLGQTAYTGRADEKPRIILTRPINKDRLAINEEIAENGYKFGEK